MVGVPREDAKRVGTLQLGLGRWRGHQLWSGDSSTGTCSICALQTAGRELGAPNGLELLKLTLLLC